MASMARLSVAIMAETIDRGSLVRRARESSGYTRERLAAEVGVSVSTLARLENSNQIPNAEALARITKAVGISLDDVLSAA